jgi:hypothetical protein
MQLGAAFPRGAHEHDREPRVERHGDERGLAESRDAFDPDLFRVDQVVGFQIVERARRAPGPRTQRAPVVRLARPAAVGEPDDPVRQPRAMVGLDARGADRGVAPPVGDQLLGGGRVRCAWRRARRRRSGTSTARCGEPGQSG